MITQKFFKKKRTMQNYLFFVSLTRCTVRTSRVFLLRLRLKKRKHFTFSLEECQIIKWSALSILCCRAWLNMYSVHGNLWLCGRDGSMREKERPKKFCGSRVFGKYTKWKVCSSSKYAPLARRRHRTLHVAGLGRVWWGNIYRQLYIFLLNKLF